MRFRLTLLAALVTATIVTSAQPPTQAPPAQVPAESDASSGLRFSFVDVEGGAATLIVTPAGESILIDSGNPGDRDAGRIAEAARQMGLTEISHYITTHWHSDHVGGIGSALQADSRARDLRAPPARSAARGHQRRPGRRLEGRVGHAHVPRGRRLHFAPRQARHADAEAARAGGQRPGGRREGGRAARRQVREGPRGPARKTRRTTRAAWRCTSTTATSICWPAATSPGTSSTSSSARAASCPRSTCTW